MTIAKWASSILILNLPTVAAAQEFEASGLILPRPVPVDTAEKIEVLLLEGENWPQDGVTPVLYTEGVGVPRSFIIKGPYYFIDSYGKETGINSEYPAWQYTHSGGRITSVTATPTFLRHCKIALQHIRSQRFSPDVQRSLGITLKTYEPIDELVTYNDTADRPRITINRLLREAADNGYRGSAGERYQEAKGTSMLLQTELGFCQGTGRGRDYGGIWGIAVSFEFTVSPKSASTANTASAPKRQENTVAPPAGPNPSLRLTRTGPPEPKPAAPKPVVYKPGVRPTPPTPPPSKPCPKGQGPCATQEGGPPTAEAIAYQEQMAAYEAALKAFEAEEAAARQAVAEANKQQQAQYAANQAALDKQRADALAARDAKIAADKAAYNAQLKAYQDESRRRAAEHEAAMADWRRRTAACLAGDKSQCANDGTK